MIKNMKRYLPKYSGNYRSGVCVCGHKWDRHHLGVVMNQDYIDQTKEGYIPQECEAFGFNEMGGLDSEGNDHCQGYVDTMNHDKL